MAKAAMLVAYMPAHKVSSEDMIIMSSSDDQEPQRSLCHMLVLWLSLY